MSCLQCFSEETLLAFCKGNASICWTGLCTARCFLSLAPCRQNTSSPTPVIMAAKNNSVLLECPLRAVLPLVDYHWHLMISAVYFISEKCDSSLCIFTVWKNTLGKKNPLYFGRLLKYHPFFMTWIHYHCQLEDFFHLAKHRWFLLWATLDPANPSVIAVAILLSLPEFVLPCDSWLWALWEHRLCLIYSLSPVNNITLAYPRHSIKCCQMNKWMRE